MMYYVYVFCMVCKYVCMKVCKYACEYACKYVLCMDMIEFVYIYSFIDVCIYHLFTLLFQKIDRVVGAFLEEKRK